MVMTEIRQGDWMQTASGRQFWPIDPRPQDIYIEDIAHALGMMCRYNGHCIKFYSVAEHSVHISRALPPEFALYGLLHDAPEAYIADIVRPAKRFIDGYVAVENRLMMAIAQRFNLPLTMPPEVKRADNAILADEAAQVMGPAPCSWNLAEPPLGVEIAFWCPRRATLEFMARFRELCPHE